MDDSELSIVKTVIICTVIVLNIIMNCLVIAVIVRYPALREDRTTLFVFSLCVSDLALGCTALPISAAFCSSASTTLRLTARHVPGIQMFFFWWFAFNSLHSLSWVALSKLVALLKPLRYEQLLSWNRCYGIIVFNWVVGAALAATTFTIVPTWDTVICAYRYQEDNVHASMLILFTYVLTAAIPGGALIFATFRMLKIVVHTHRDIIDQMQMVAAGTGTDAYKTQLATMQAIRSAKNILVICFASMTLGVPLLIFGVLHYAAQTQPSSKGFDFSAVWLTVIHSLTVSCISFFISACGRRLCTCSRICETACVETKETRVFCLHHISYP